MGELEISMPLDLLIENRIVDERRLREESRVDRVKSYLNGMGWGFVVVLLLSIILVLLLIMFEAYSLLYVFLFLYLSVLVFRNFIFSDRSVFNADLGNFRVGKKRDLYLLRGRTRDFFLLFIAIFSFCLFYLVSEFIYSLNLSFNQLILVSVLTCFIAYFVLEERLSNARDLSYRLGELLRSYSTEFFGETIKLEPKQLKLLGYFYEEGIKEMETRGVRDIIDISPAAASPRKFMTLPWVKVFFQIEADGRNIKPKDIKFKLEHPDIELSKNKVDEIEKGLKELFKVRCLLES